MKSHLAMGVPIIVDGQEKKGAKYTQCKQTEYYIAIDTFDHEEDGVLIHATR